MPANNIISPCPISPNIRENRKGNVIIVKGAKLFKIRKPPINSTGVHFAVRCNPISINYILKNLGELIRFVVSWCDFIGFHDIQYGVYGGPGFSLKILIFNIQKLQLRVEVNSWLRQCLFRGPNIRRWKSFHSYQMWSCLACDKCSFEDELGVSIQVAQKQHHVKAKHT